MSSKAKNIYWDINKTLSRQRLFNFVLGPRGCGKTYGWKKYVINRFLKYGKQFVYVRRYETEMPAAEMRNFFDDVGPKEYPDIEFKAYNGIFRINNKIAGWYVPLSKAAMLKSTPFPNVESICFDEFIIATGKVSYLTNEVRQYLELYSTVSRDRDITAFFLANSISIANPYFIYFNISFEPEQKVKLLPLISVEFVENPAFIEHVNQTKFGQLIAGTEYGNYAIENKFLLDKDTFVEKMPGDVYYICTLLAYDREFGLYRSSRTSIMYIAETTDPTNKTRISMSIEDHNPGTMLALRKNLFLQAILNAFSQGQLRFTTQNVKNLLYDSLRRLI